MRQTQPFKPVLDTVLALFGFALPPGIMKIPLILAVIAGSTALFIFIIRSNRTARARKSAWEKASRIISENLDHLTRRRAQLVRQDAHGRPLSEKWKKEAEYFIASEIAPSLSPQEHRHLPSQKPQLVGLITQLTYLHMQQDPEKAA